MKTKPRFVTIDTELFADGQAVVFDAAGNRFIPTDGGVTLSFVGDWTDSIEYAKNDVVAHGGASYVCINAHESSNSNKPNSGADWTDYWQLLAEKGATGADGANGANGSKGAPGAKGDTGEGVPSGGTTGQLLAKKSSSNYDTEWINAPSGGGGSGNVDAAALQAQILNSILVDENGDVITDNGEVLFDGL